MPCQTHGLAQLFRRDNKRPFPGVVLEATCPRVRDVVRVERAWLKEAQRRSQELDTGAVEAIPADEVFAKARDQLKRR